MAKKRPDSPFSDDIEKGLRGVVRPVSTAQVVAFGMLREIRDRSYRIRTIVKAWKDQQTQDRAMRERYANYLIVAMGVQALIVNVVFVLIGANVLTFEAWTAKTFIMAVFAEIAAMVLLIVKYLFTRSSDKVLQFLDEKWNTTGKARSSR